MEFMYWKKMNKRKVKPVTIVVFPDGKVIWDVEYMDTFKIINNWWLMNPEYSGIGVNPTIAHLKMPQDILDNIPANSWAAELMEGPCQERLI